MSISPYPLLKTEKFSEPICNAKKVDYDEAKLYGEKYSHISCFCTGDFDTVYFRETEKVKHLWFMTNPASYVPFIFYNDTAIFLVYTVKK